MSVNHQQLKVELAAKTRHVAARAAAGSRVAKSAILAPISGATTIGEKAVVFGSVAGFCAFFLPWLTPGPFSGSGLQGAGTFAWIWLLPLSVIGCFVSSWLLSESPAPKRILAARWFIVIGMFWFTPGVMILSNVRVGVPGFGLYLASLAAASILAGGVLQISAYLNRVLNFVLAVEKYL
jgi:hypothetical protein